MLRTAQPIRPCPSRSVERKYLELCDVNCQLANRPVIKKPPEVFFPPKTRGSCKGSNGQQRTKRSEEPPVLSARVALLEHLLHVLLCVLPLADLLEGVVGHGALKALELERVAGGHEVVVVDNLDEGLYLVALLLARLGHAPGDLEGVALDASNDSVAVRVQLVA